MLTFQERMRSRGQSENLKQWKLQDYRLKSLNYLRKNKKSCVQLSYQKMKRKMNLEIRIKNSKAKRK